MNLRLGKRYFLLQNTFLGIKNCKFFMCSESCDEFLWSFAKPTTRCWRFKPISKHLLVREHFENIRNWFLTLRCFSQFFYSLQFPQNQLIISWKWKQAAFSLMMLKVPNRFSVSIEWSNWLWKQLYIRCVIILVDDFRVWTSPDSNDTFLTTCINEIWIYRLIVMGPSHTENWLWMPSQA